MFSQVVVVFATLVLTPKGPVLSSILTDMERPVPVTEKVVEQGSTAFLPCDVGSKDDIFLILWFKDNATKPIYSIDVMGKPLKTASQWSDSSDLGGRSTFSDPAGQTGLLIDNILQEDEGIYRCRVDYKNSPTKNFKINLSVTVPPGPPVIVDERGRPINQYDLGPFEVGDDLEIICQVKGGSPSPSVTWWKEGTIFDNTHEEEFDGTITNKMKYINLKREDLGTKFICQSSNSNSTLPLSQEVNINLNLPPTGLAIQEKPTYVSEGVVQKVHCRAVGGYPPPTIQWWIGTNQLRPQYKNAEYQGVSTSSLHYLPVIEDDGRYLTCRVIITGKKELVLEDTWEIKVLYKPKVELRLGPSLDPDNLRTGNDVYFECNVKANPIPHRLLWFHNGEELESDPGSGIIMSTQSLVLQGVNRNTSGEYICQAVNSEGSGTSRVFNLNIMYAPVCKSMESSAVLMSAELDEPTMITCQVDAFPRSVTFRWFFNNSELEEWISPQSYQESGLSSSLQFVPKSSKDYGNLYCIGENLVGGMAEPCVYQILPTGSPSPLTECLVTNKTLSSMNIECTEGFDGGLPASFLLQIFDAETMNLSYQVVNKVPEFEVSHLMHGAGLKIYIYAENAKGMSDPVVLEESMPASTSHIIQPADVSKAVMVSSTNLEEGNSQLTIIISVAAGGCVVCLSLLISILLCGRKRIEVLREKRAANCDIGEHRLINNKYSQGGSECGSGVQDNLRGYGSDPDLIPQTNYIYGGENYTTTDFTSNSVYNRKSLENSSGAGEGSGGPLPLALISTNLPPPSGYGEIASGNTSRPPFPASSNRLPESQVQRGSVRRGSDPRERGSNPTERGSSSTLGRKLQRIPDAYPLYHTCTRKKRVTIVESKKGESEV